MALTKPEVTLKGQSLMIAASAYRVKYRKQDVDGRTLKQIVPVQTGGCHKYNRGSIYPAGIRCQTLCKDVLEAGFDKEESNDRCVVVEERPVEEVLRNQKSAEPFVSSSLYNANKCSKDELLVTCFQEPFNDVRHSFLAHNHMLIICRAFLTKAKWDMPNSNKCGTRVLQFCEADGRLSLTAVAAHENGRQLAELVSEGFHCEVLSWKMDVEEPGAAAIISAALNQPASCAMRTTELNAIAVLKGEIIFQMGKDISQRVAFSTVRERVRAELHNAADDPDLAEIFDFLISNGVGANEYITSLLDWTAVFVDSTRRQLRFQAFAIVNKMCSEAVWSKMALIKRAYKHVPSNGYCQSPEPAWGSFQWRDLQLLEELLRFFHVSCKKYVDKLSQYDQQKLLGNIDISAADEFLIAKDPRRRHNHQKVKEMLLSATRKHLETLELDKCIVLQQSGFSARVSQGSAFCEDTFPGKADWIAWPKDGRRTVQAEVVEEENAATGAVSSAAAVIRFDPKTGERLTDQVDFSLAVAKSSVPIELPWQEWRQITSLGENNADKAAAVAALQDLHYVDCDCIQLWDTQGKISVKANKKTNAKDILLAPCVPKQGKVVDKTEHPHAVELNMHLQFCIEERVDGSNDEVKRRRKYFVLPEFTPPKRSKPKHTGGSGEAGAQTAVAGKLEQLEAAVAEAAEEADWQWDPDGKESMNPFWAVRRLTENRLRAEPCAPGQLPCRFNCEIVNKSISVMTIMTLAGETRNVLRVFQMPFLTNSHDLEAGEELILQVVEQVAPPKKARTWRDAANAEAAVAAVKAKKQKH